MRRLLLHHFLFLWLRAHLFCLPVGHAVRSVQIVCGDFSVMDGAQEMESDVMEGFDVRIRHPAMFGHPLDLVEGFKYEVTFSSHNDAMEVQGVAVIATTNGSNPSPQNLASEIADHKCEHHHSRPIPPTPVQVTFSSLAHSSTDQSTFPSSHLLPEMAASEVDITSTFKLTSSSSSELTSSVSYPTQPLSSPSDVPSSSPLPKASSSGSSFSSPVVLSSSLSSIGSSSSLTASSSVSSTPELLSSLPRERFSEHLPFSLAWTADAFASPCLTLT
ncbi:hypothetical protein V1264_000815 [Littorina saxatilis]|uniref:Uncharacterized protein n=1 Tax=Littorina saxatilis TaxID=31220 RepID=A0AAN9C010_9CAEN